MEILLEDYKRRLKTVTELIKKTRSNGSIVHQRREERLNTKAAEYRTFITEIERAMARKPDTSENTLPIESVSGSLPNDKTIEFLFENGAHAPFYSDILEEVGHAGYHFINGMKAMRNIMLASNDR
jgi:hypothetical protein